MRRNLVHKRQRRRIRKVMASVTGAALLSSAVMGVPAAKAAESAKTQKTDALTEALLKSKEEIQGKIRAAIEEKAKESIAGLKNNPGLAGQVLNQSKEALAAKIKEGIEAKAVEKGNEIKEQLTEFFRPKQGEKEIIENVRATAYTSGPEDNGRWDDKTYIGSKVRPGIIAVDPKVIPLGSKVYVEFENGEGFQAVAEDTGGAIKGNRIDIALPDRESVREFGIKNVKVHVLERGTVV